MFSTLSNLKKQKAAIEVEIAKLKLLHMQQSFLPHMNVPVTVCREGSHWKCIFYVDEEEINCVVAYGSCPAQACANFDALWNGDFVDLEEEEEEEEL